MHVERAYSGARKTITLFYMNYFNLQVIPAKPSRSAKQTPIEFGSPHEAICAGFFDICLTIEIEIVHSEPANWTDNHLSGLCTQPYTTYEQV
jgi:hypothetical protein